VVGKSGNLEIWKPGNLSFGPGQTRTNNDGLSQAYTESIAIVQVTTDRGLEMEFRASNYPEIRISSTVTFLLKSTTINSF
jgi:hypothetical protein